ncbi:hypothetical protein A3844_05810 [Paenibacillus helianthi]|uniref:DUF2809 domain-containing protein n=1 Tax=Paenibacillus helianthi TaxID=1349432 RepID=A0ABX3ES86_9BACL|nr:hypothetical protein A3844_05810 [Paenibacillus helianthi]
MKVVRAKIVYGYAVLICIILGLSSRVCGDWLPPFAAKHLGDALWASMIYFICRVLFTRRQRWLSLVLSLCFSFGIEFSQLYQSEWINVVRDSVLGGLILGKGFLWIDLLRYTAGIMSVYALDRICSPRMIHQDK